MYNYQFNDSTIDPYFRELSNETLSELVKHFHSKDLSIPKIIEKYKLEEITNNRFVKRFRKLGVGSH